MTACMLLAALGLNLALPALPGHWSSAAVGYPLLLAIVFLLVEVVPLHIEWAGQAYSVSLSEAPLVMGLFFCPTLLLVLARAVGGGVALARFRRQPPHKLAFNIGLQLLEATIALTLFRGFAGVGELPAMTVAPDAVLAVFAGYVVSITAVCVAVRVSVGQLDRGVIASFARMSTFGLVVNSSIALVLATALQASGTVAVPMAVMLVASGCVYRAYVALRQRHASLEMLYQFTSGLNQTTSTDHRVRDILRRTRVILRADIAGLLLTGGDAAEPAMFRWADETDTLRTDRYVEADTDRPFRRVLDDARVVVIPRASRDEDHQRFLDSRGFRDAVIAPLSLDGQVRGALFVANRQGDVVSFTVDDGRLFQTVAAQVSSVLDNSRLLDRLTHDSLHDALTGLANRQCFQNRLRTALAARRPRAAVLLADLDRFKEINDTLGHHHGDLLIREIAGRISDTAPAVATVARLGGDEFAVLVPDIDVASAQELAGRIRAAIAAPCTLDGVSVDVDASIGVAAAPEHGLDASVLLKRADMAMYAAKSGHRGVEVYDEQRDEYSARRLALASKLRGAIDRCELTLHYQPLVDATYGRTVGVEALVRWEHPDFGLVPPGEFVPIAEQSGLIADLTLWVLDNAIQQLSEWRSAGITIGMSINVSMRNLLDASIVDAMSRLLSVYDLPASLLTLEITESHIMSDPARTLPVLHRLAALGVRLSVDDFGTGYSSLAYLHELPVHEVKIDKSFVRGEVDTLRDGAIVRAIVSLAQHLGLETVAEGIEDEDAARSLVRLGCTRLQGFHIARPMPPVLFEKWLRARRVPRPTRPLDATPLRRLP